MKPQLTPNGAPISFRSYISMQLSISFSAYGIGRRAQAWLNR